MFSLTLGNATEEVSRLTIKGLPSLEIPVGKGGYFDGYVANALSLRQLFLTKNYEDILAMATAIGYEIHRPLKQFQTGTLASLQLLNSWTRVQIVKRISVSRVTVYFIDTGIIRDVDISNLYELQSKLRNTPPLAFPIFIDNEAAEVDYAELQRLKGVKVTVKLDEKGDDGIIHGSEFTVFEKNSRSNSGVVRALRNPEFDMDRVEQPVYVEMKRYEGISTTTVASVVTSTSLLVTILLVVFLFIGAIFAIAFYMFRKRKQKTIEDEGPPPVTNMSMKTVVEKENCPLPTTITNLSPQKDELSSIILIDSDDLAVITATIALANFERDIIGEKISTTEEEEFTRDDLPGKVISIQFERAIGGLSELSSIRSNNSFHPRCSTPVVSPTFTPLRQSSSRQPSAPKRSAEYHDLSDYSEILDVRQYISNRSRNILDRTVNLPIKSNETTFMTAPNSPEKMDR